MKTSLTFVTPLIFVNPVNRVVLMITLFDQCMKVVGTKIDDSDYERFETFCLDKGISKSEIIRGLIRDYCDSCEEKLQTPSEIQKPIITIIDE